MNGMDTESTCQSVAHDAGTRSSGSALPSDRVGARRRAFTSVRRKPRYTHLCLGLTCVLTMQLATNHASAADYSFASGTRQVTVIELFTSQGCSSCPPAEAWLSEFVHDPRLWREIIPVAFHVDYWDNLGWRDAWSKPAHSVRQRRYRDDGNIRAVYTPGFVVNGEEWRVSRVRLPSAPEGVGRLSLRVRGQRVLARYLPISEVKKPLQLNVVILGTGVTNEITAGENRGRVLTQDFVVLSHDQELSYNGRWEIELPTYPKPPRGRLALAAWISRIDDQAPLQATGGWISRE